MENKYSEWLLVSDIDGTLNDKKMQLPENNRLAINDFVSRGGNFTLCSGRNLESLTIHYKKLGVMTPAIFLNGAGIYDFSSEKMLQYTPITPEGEKIILDVIKSNKFLQLTVYSADKIYLATRKCIYGYIISKMDKLSFELCRRISDLPSGNWGKVTFFGPRSVVMKLQENFKSEKYNKMFDCFLTSPFTLEVVKSGVNKGSAVKRLIEMLGVEQFNTAAIGDYYNDVEMLKAVGHSCCCGQAPEDIKEICEYIACHCNDGAVADFINYLKTYYIK
ncbi:MAG: HAD family hydrolase [Ruminococcaceae bacterium]|nr:HAD family hydrolase [Oscillospiraceae bacterium]